MLSIMGYVIVIDGEKKSLLAESGDSGGYTLSGRLAQAINRSGDARQIVVTSM